MIKFSLSLMKDVFSVVYLKSTSISLFILFSFILLQGCGDDGDNNSNSDFIGYKVYYVYEGSGGQKEIELGTSSSRRLGATFELYIKNCLYDSIWVTSNNTNIKIEEKGNYTYSCTVENSGEASIYLMPFTIGEGIDEDNVGILYYDVENIRYKYLTTENSYVVDVENSLVVTNKIQNELQHCIPEQWSYIEIEQVALNGGDFLYRDIAKDTIKGVFGIDNSTDNEKLSLYYNNLTSDILIELIEGNRYYLKQDLTEEFREKYPLEEINEVAIISNAIKQ